MGLRASVMDFVVLGLMTRIDRFAVTRCIVI